MIISEFCRKGSETEGESALSSINRNSQSGKDKGSLIKLLIGR